MHYKADTKISINTKLTCWPRASVCEPIIMVFIPDEQTLLMVVQTVLVGSPPKMAACRAGAWPRPAETTFPMYTSLTSDAAIPARFTTASIAIPPNWVAESEDNALWKLPIGVRVAATIKTSWIFRELYERAADTATCDFHVGNKHYSRCHIVVGLTRSTCICLFNYITWHFRFNVINYIFKTWFHTFNISSNYLHYLGWSQKHFILL